MMTKLTGSCLCGSLSFSGDVDIQRIVNCHCKDCQNATGSAFGTLIFAPESQVKIEGVPYQFTHFSDRGSAMTKVFCKNCGTQMFSKNSSNPNAIAIRAGSVDQRVEVRPQMNIFCSSALVTTAMDEDLPKFDGMPR